MTTRNARRFAPALALLLLAAGGCATKKYVNSEVGETRSAMDEKVGAVETEVETVQGRLDEHDEKIGEISSTAQDALDRAIAAGKLAEGKFLYETVLTDDSVHFPFDKATLSDEAKTALDQFAEQLRTQNANVYVEIQGHTDATGTEDYNLDLGEARAEAVRRYLNLEEGLPLNRMSVISYGETAPIADNGNRDGRAQNRRVALVVLQ
ncbi:MAG: OmpA family protein [Thermoanaerobaculia bacterium]